MNDFPGGMDSLFWPHAGCSRAVTAENPSGEKGRGGTAAGSLGPARKGAPCIRLAPGATATLADLDGPGIIRHIWITVTDQTTAEGPFVLRDLVLRIYWEGESAPSVECPLGDFFCCGFGRGCRVDSLPIAVNPTRGFNCYFPMPFARHVKITLESQHEAEISAFFYQIDYHIDVPLPDDLLHFHARWRREPLTEYQKDYTILDGVQGRGCYVGTFLALSSLARYWWGEGEVKFYLDGDREYPTICGTGTEDYFGGAWSFASQPDGKTAETTFCSPFSGYPYRSARDDHIDSPYYQDDCPTMRGLYRWHIPDPVLFSRNIRVTLQQIGVGPRGLFERQDDVASVAYWYQSEPHRPFPALLPREARRPR